MINLSHYKNALIAALILHISLALVLLIEPMTSQSSFEMSAQPQAIQAPAVQSSPSVEPIRAVSIDNQEVMKAVKQLKAEQEQKAQAQAAHQKMLAKQAEAARLARIQEQNRLAKLKQEADSIAIARKKAEEQEKKRLKELAEKQEQEKKQLEALKKEHDEMLKRQKEEAKKFAEMEKKKAEELAKLNQQKLEKLKQDKLKQEQALAASEALAKKQEADRLLKAQQDAANAQAAANAKAQQARMAGEVDRYKAMIVNAIGRQWILPEKVNQSLSSQFRIRLAPNGAVLNVTLTRSSGDTILDRSAQSAIYKASPLPVPTDAATFDLFRDITLTVRPESIRG